MATPMVGNKKSMSTNGPSKGSYKALKQVTSEASTPETGDEADDSAVDNITRKPVDNSESDGYRRAEETKPKQLQQDSGVPQTQSEDESEIVFDLNPETDTKNSLQTNVAQSDSLKEIGRPVIPSGRRRHREAIGADLSNLDSDMESESNPNNQEGSDATRERNAASEEDEESENSSQSKQDSRIWRARMKCGKIVNHEYVQIAIIILIIVNALMMGIGTMDFIDENPTLLDIFSEIDRAFLIVFTIEVSMQLFYLGLTLFSDGWLVFDFMIVVVSWSFESLQIVRAFRIFRAFRLITRVKPLRDLVLAIGAVLPRMYAIAALLLLIFYIFSVLFTELFSELPLEDNYFGSLDASLFTCMEMMTLEWGDISREVMLHYTWAWAPFSAFIALTGFIVFNLIVAVVCDAVAITEKNVREMDGYERDDPVNKLSEAQERIDLLQCHINDMLKTQEQVQTMIETMAGEMLHLEAERMKAESRAAELRIEVTRRSQYQRNMDSTRQIQSLERSYTNEKERRESERKLKEARRKLLQEQERSDSDLGDNGSSSGILASPRHPKHRQQRRGSNSASSEGVASVRSLFVRDLSFQSASSKDGRGDRQRSLSRDTRDANRDKPQNANRENSGRSTRSGGSKGSKDSWV